MGFFVLLDFRVWFFFCLRSSPEDYQIIQSENLSNRAVRFDPVIVILSFLHTELQFCVGLKSNL